jgi:ABC-type Zn2+ transport system substrate-binding protein/surface adhesin
MQDNSVNNEVEKMQLKDDSNIAAGKLIHQHTGDHEHSHAHSHDHEHNHDHDHGGRLGMEIALGSVVRFCNTIYNAFVEVCI